MEKTYERINWENYPSVVTPINEKNLNKMDSALDEVDNRVIGLDTAKLDKSIANTMIKDLDVDETTGIFTITYLNGTEKKVDTGLEKIATNFSYNRYTQKLVLTSTDGTEQEVDLSSLISQYEFTDSDYITFEVGNDGKVKATIKSGSITEDMLQPNFLADIKVESEKAKSSANSASNSANEAKQYRDETEQMKNEMEAVTNVEIATTQKAGIVKPDGETITIDSEGRISAKQQESTSSWGDLKNKPFSTVGDGLTVKDEKLNVDMLKTMEEITANEDENKLASALAVKELYGKTSPKQFEYMYSSDIQTDVKNCIEQAISLYGTDISLNAFWLSKTSNGINAYSGMVTLTSNLSKSAIRIEGTYICSARNIIITFLYNATDKIFFAFNNFDETIPKKEIGLNFYHNVDIVSRNACFKQNGVYYIDVMINVLADIPYTTSTVVFEIIEDSQPITFNKRLDIFLQGIQQTGLLFALDGYTAFAPNSNDLKAGIYRMTLIYQP